ncbi:MAG: histidine phosphatase family protein [Phycisphaerales bacterium]
MKLWIVRHGKAERDSPLGDRGRRLTDRGRAQAFWLGQYLAGQDPPPRIILASGYERTKETAGIIAEPMARAVRLESDLEVGSASRALRLIEAERTLALDPLIIVGHQPQLCGLIALLTGGAGASADRIPLRTGQAYLLVLPDDDELIGAGEVRAVVRMP